MTALVAVQLAAIAVLLGVAISWLSKIDAKLTVLLRYLTDPEYRAMREREHERRR